MFSASLWIIIDYELTNAVHSAAQTPEGMISGGVKCRKYIPPLSIYLKSSFFFKFTLVWIIQPKRQLTCTSWSNTAAVIFLLLHWHAASLFSDHDPEAGDAVAHSLYDS